MRGFTPIIVDLSGWRVAGKTISSEKRRPDRKKGRIQSIVQREPFSTISDRFVLQLSNGVRQMMFPDFVIARIIAESVSDFKNRELEQEVLGLEEYSEELEQERDDLIEERNNLQRENSRLRTNLADSRRLT